MPGPFHRQVMSSNEKTDFKSLKKLAAYIKKYIPIIP
mgnify:FL=1